MLSSFEPVKSHWWAISIWVMVRDRSHKKLNSKNPIPYDNTILNKPTFFGFQSWKTKSLLVPWTLYLNLRYINQNSCWTYQYTSKLPHHHMCFWPPNKRNVNVLQSPFPTYGFSHRLRFRVSRKRRHLLLLPFPQPLSLSRILIALPGGEPCGDRPGGEDARLRPRKENEHWGEGGGGEGVWLGDKRCSSCQSPLLWMILLLILLLRFSRTFILKSSLTETNINIDFDSYVWQHGVGDVLIHPYMAGCRGKGKEGERRISTTCFWARAIHQAHLTTIHLRDRMRIRSRSSWEGKIGDFVMLLTSRILSLLCNSCMNVANIFYHIRFVGEVWWRLILWMVSVGRRVEFLSFTLLHFFFKSASCMDL